MLFVIKFLCNNNVVCFSKTLFFIKFKVCTMKIPGFPSDVWKLSYLVLSVAVWWTANSISAIASKTVMEDTNNYNDKQDAHSLATVPMLDFRWLELTALQHLLGVLVTVFWLKLFLKKSLWPAKEASKNIIIMAALGNVLGNLATNAAYASVSSSMTQVVKACEPLFTFFLSIFLYRDYKQMNVTTLVSVVIMVTGASLFVAYDGSFNVIGLLAALCSAVSFPVRNIFLKKLSNVWDSSIQKYAVLSLYSVLLLTPVMLIKLVYFQSFSLIAKLQESVLSSVFHCTYNMASIHVLQSFTPLTHAILNLLKRGIVITVNIAYFEIPISWKMATGLGAVLLGLYFYQKKSSKESTCSANTSILAIIPCLLLSLFLFPDKKCLVSSTNQKEAVSTFTWKDILPRNSSIVNDGCLDLSLLTKLHPSTVPQPHVWSTWVFDRPIPAQIVANLQTLSYHAPIHVYCGTSHCLNTINKLNSRNVSAEFLLVGDLVKYTPLQKWLARQAFYKVIAGRSFEAHLKEVVRLSILWKYGGLYIDSNVAISGKTNGSFPACQQQAWVGTLQQKEIQSSEESIIACFPKQHPFIEKVMGIFIEEYSHQSHQFATSDFTTDNKTLNLYLNSYQGNFPKIYKLCCDALPTETDIPWNHHYGTLSYDTRVSDTGVANLGDEIQGFPGLQFLPFSDNFLERDNTRACNRSQNILSFFNAWWGSRYVRAWPPPPSVDPILISIHIGDGMKSKWTHHINYLRSKSPIGCRDYATLEFFNAHKVPAFFSGCITLLMHTPNVDAQRTDDIYIVDVKDEYIKLLPKDVRQKGIRINHDMSAGNICDKRSRYGEAFKLMEMYSKAKLVITQRIHCALPCVAMGTPVIFINSDGMPGGGGSRTSSSTRTRGLTSMFHTLDVYNIGHSKVSSWFHRFPWENIPPNPDLATVMRLRATAWNVIREKPSLYDASRKFGVIPMSPPGPPCGSSLIFHLIFTSPNDMFTWYHHRSIESIFRHHPCGQVLVHSNSLDEHRFDALKESGYSIIVNRYDMKSLLQEATPKMLDSNVEITKLLNDQETLLRLLILYKWGGLYMDFRIIVTKPLNDLPGNVLVWADPNEVNVNGAFMKFKKSNPYLESSIKEYAKQLDVGEFTDYQFFTKRLTKSSSGLSDYDIHILNYKSLHVFTTRRLDIQCYYLTSGDVFEVNMNNIKENAFFVYLPSVATMETADKGFIVKPGTICKTLLNDFCVLCNIIL